MRAAAKFFLPCLRTSLSLLLMAGLTAWPLALGPLAHAQADPARTITVRMLDARTGLLIESNNFLVRVDHKPEQHGDWIEKNEDGTGKFDLPAGVQLVAIRATYDYATQTYVNCDVSKDKGSADHAGNPLRWYPVDAILTNGVVAPNDCAGKKIPDKLQVVARPGEFVFFVRQENPMEKMRD